jgi:DNA-binding XRE family transcriptional regulator
MLAQKLRLQRGWSQEQLAELSGLSVRTIQRIERGSTASVESLKALGVVFEVDFSSLKEVEMSATETPNVTPNVTSREALALAHVRRVKGFYVHLMQYGAFAGCRDAGRVVTQLHEPQGPTTGRRSSVDRASTLGARRCPPISQRPVARIRVPVAPAASVAVPEIAVTKAAAVPAAETTEAMGRSRGGGECSAAQRNGRDEREADHSQHDAVLLWMRMGVIAQPAPFVRLLVRAVHAGALLQIASVLWRCGDGNRPGPASTAKLLHYRIDCGRGDCSREWRPSGRRADHLAVAVQPRIV